MTEVNTVAIIQKNIGNKDYLMNLTNTEKEIPILEDLSREFIFLYT